MANLATPSTYCSTPICLSTWKFCLIVLNNDPSSQQSYRPKYHLLIHDVTIFDTRMVWNYQICRTLELLRTIVVFGKLVRKSASSGPAIRSNPPISEAIRQAAPKKKSRNHPCADEIPCGY